MLNFIKKETQTKVDTSVTSQTQVFLVNFVEFLRAHFSIEHLRWLLPASPMAAS